jgi:phospholipid/cholesterol/gamma-HCH transport system substrate-binding protein
MSPYRRNILVGITVLLALIALGWMILKFGDRPARLFATPSMSVVFHTDRADGVGEGSNITYLGVIVGRVTAIHRTDTEVILDAEIDRDPPLPANLLGEIRQISQLGGTSNIHLVTIGAKGTGLLQPHATLRAHYEGLTLFPPEFSDLAIELRKTVTQFRESNLIAHIDQQVNKAGTLLDSANSFISDPKLKDDIKTTLAELRSASEKINKIVPKIDKLSDDASATMGDVRKTVVRTGDNVDTATKQLGDRLQQVSKTLDHFESITAKIDNGQGTAGQLVNDPKLYQALVDSSRELNATIVDLKRLVEQWEQEGVSLKLK